MGGYILMILQVTHVPSCHGCMHSVWANLTCLNCLQDNTAVTSLLISTFIQSTKPVQAVLLQFLSTLNHLCILQDPRLFLSGAEQSGKQSACC